MTHPEIPGAQHLLAQIRRIKEKFEPSEWSLRISGEMFLGSPTKVSIGPGGQRSERLWTMDEIVAGMERALEQDGDATRTRLLGEVMDGLEALDESIASLSDSGRRTAVGVRDMMMAILERVAVAPDNLADDFPMFPTEGRKEAQIAEVFRRELLETPYLLIEDLSAVPAYDESGFWSRTEHPSPGDVLARRSPEDWEALVQRQENYIVSYLRNRLVRSNRGDILQATFRFTRLEEFLIWTRTNISPDASFQTLLQLTKPDDDLF